VFDFFQNPSFIDHFKRRSENTKYIFGNNKDLTPDLGGQLKLTNYIQRQQLSTELQIDTYWPCGKIIGIN
jgi:hypothetical protein